MTKTTNLNLSTVCRICLKSSPDVRIAKYDELVTFQTIVGKVHSIHLGVYLCIYCGHMVTKHGRFTQQCQKSNELLQIITEQNQNLSLLAPTESLSSFTTFTYNCQICDVPDAVDEKILNADVKQELEDSIFGTQSDGDDVDDDNVPLVMLTRNEEIAADSSKLDDIENNFKTTQKKKKKKHKKKEKYLDAELKSEPNAEESQFQDPHEKTYSKQADIIKRGFSSRMVQETDQYEVIKLSKAEVLAEMEAKSKTEQYLRAPFKCERCIKGFNFEDILNTHLTKHTQVTGHLLCDICFQYCPSAVSMRGHMKSHTTRYKCKACGEIRLSRQNLLEHHSSQHLSSAPVYSCRQCDMSTTQNLLEHHSIQHLSSAPVYSCRQCDMSTTQNLLEHHSSQYLSSAPMNSCLQCDMSTIKRTVMQRHVRSHAQRSEHACDRCGKTFKSVANLRVHVARHNKSMLFQCAECGSKFIYRSLLKNHIRAVHVHSEYYCVECDVKFTTAENLRTHLTKTKKHRDESSLEYPCPVCYKHFPTQYRLKSHVDTPDLVRRHAYPCPVCYKHFPTQYRLKSHVATHQAGRRHACSKCDKSYFYAVSLKTHDRRVHCANYGRRYDCALCHKSFKDKTVLVRHSRTHTGERPHACGECSLRFSQKSTLDTHVTIVHRKLPRSKKQRMALQQASNIPEST